MLSITTDYEHSLQNLWLCILFVPQFDKEVGQYFKYVENVTSEVLINRIKPIIGSF